MQYKATINAEKHKPVIIGKKMKTTVCHVMQTVWNTNWYAAANHMIIAPTNTIPVSMSRNIGQ